MNQGVCGPCPTTVVRSHPASQFLVTTTISEAGKPCIDQNTNTKVQEAIAQPIGDDMVASIGHQQEDLRIRAIRVVGVRSGQEEITHDPSASTSPDRAIGTEMFSVLSLKSALAAV